MLVHFEKLPPTARIWIYQSNRDFSPQETTEITETLHQFLERWTAHGANLEAALDIRYRRFIIIGLNQEVHAASGCSIDASVHCIQALEKAYNIDLLDRMNVSFRQGNNIMYQDLKSFRKLAKQKHISENTTVFNNLVTTKEEYQTVWEVPAAQSWHSRFF